MVKRINVPVLSPFAVPIRSSCCKFAVCGFDNGLMNADQIYDLYSWLLSNGYKIDTSLTKMMNSNDVFIDKGNLLCMKAFKNFLLESFGKRTHLG